MFKVLTTHPNVEVLDRAAEIVRKAHAIRATTPDWPLYDGAKFFVENVLKQEMKDVRGDTKGCGKENPSATNGASALLGFAAGKKSEGRTDGFEPFEPLLMAVLSSDGVRQAGEPESHRASRVALAGALAEHGVKDSAALAAILSTWLQTERSRPLREAIERALQATS